MKTPPAMPGKVLAVISVLCFWLLPVSPILSMAAVSATGNSGGWARGLARAGAWLCVTYTTALAIIFLNLCRQISFPG
jgi:hypothetical protein